MDTESLILTAFMLGIVSACSLPLGTISAAFWRPADRTIAFLMAFGGGALLAALTIDLVGSALDKGYFTPLAFGCIIGGVLFVVLNEVVNDYGGFMRKASTTIFHMRKQDYRQFRRILSSVSRVDVFKGLSKHSFRALASAMYRREYRKGSLIFRPGDPADALYLVSSGTIELLDPADSMAICDVLRERDAFDWMAFVSGAPHPNAALAVTDVTVWVLPRGDFLALIPNSSQLLQAIHRELRSTEIDTYLKEKQGLTSERIRSWSDNAVKSLLGRGVYPEAITIERRDDEFCELSPQIGRFTLLQNLPRDELDEIASHLIVAGGKRLRPVLPVVAFQKARRCTLLTNRSPRT